MRNVFVFIICFVIVLVIQGRPTCVSTEGGKTINREHCIADNAYCGDMDVKKRTWTPLRCDYREVTVEQARKCLAHRTVSCVGDSQIRDLCFALAMFLSNSTTVQSATNHKYDRFAHIIETISTQVDPFPMWLHSKLKIDGKLRVFPKRNYNNTDAPTYQIQVHECLLKSERLDFALEDIATNKIITHRNHTQKQSDGTVTKEKYLKPADIVLNNFGTHELLKSPHTTWFMRKDNEKPIGELYYTEIMKKFLTIQNTTATVPMVWVSMNQRCVMYINSTELTLEKITLQTFYFDHINRYVHKRLRDEKVPYWDASNILRTWNRCEFAPDPVHVAFWVEIIRAKVLLNYLCDENFNWVGSRERFIV